MYDKRLIIHGGKNVEQAKAAAQWYLRKCKEYHAISSGRKVYFRVTNLKAVAGIGRPLQLSLLAQHLEENGVLTPGGARSFRAAGFIPPLSMNPAADAA